MFEGDLIVFESDSDDDDYGQMFTVHLSNVELNEQLSTTLESIASSNSKDRISHFVKYPIYYNYLVIRLELRNVLQFSGQTATKPDKVNIFAV